MKNKAAQELGKLSVKKSPNTHSSKHMKKLAKNRWNKNKQNEIRQGDVRLSRVKELPKGAKPLKDKTLAYGEVTGHSHRFVNPENIERYQVADKVYLQVFKPTGLTHEEHNQWKKYTDGLWSPDPGIILPGVYEQIQEREYNYIDETFQTVID